MSRFNATSAATHKTTNLAGGSAYKMTPELELVSSLLTSFLNDSFYESGKKRQVNIEKQVKAVDPLFAAKASVFARNEYGMRSVSHVVAAEIASTVKGEQWTKRYFDKIVHRPDDMMEILSLYRANGGKNEPAALKKGFASAFGRFDEYQLAKYRGTTKSVKLVDVVNLVHPAHTEAIRKLVNDELRNADTFEAKLSKAGQSGKEDAKGQAWSELVKSGKLGYFALLRNLRNIVEEAPEVTDLAIEQLTNGKAIRKSLVLPFRFITAAEEISKIQGQAAKKMLVGISQALDVSVENVPRFKGETLVAVDCSSSMTQGMYSNRSTTTRPMEKAALFAAMLVKSSMADVMLWDNSAYPLNCNPTDSVISIAQQIALNAHNGGTNIAVPFREATRAYDRIVILTDEQSWGHSAYGYATSGPQELEAYRKRTGANPMVYNWDLAGYGQLAFPENQVATLAGWSDKVFSIMELVETDKRALVHTINGIEI
jgi:60 kDa SS-A/Ro ribonucleoprotein